MEILFLPQVNDQDKIEYKFKGEVITVTFNGVTDVFDFSELPEDGYAINTKRQTDIETTLPYCPINEAWREDGVLYVKALKFIDTNASYEERFPDWIEV